MKLKNYFLIIAFIPFFAMANQNTNELVQLKSKIRQQEIIMNQQAKKLVNLNLNLQKQEKKQGQLIQQIKNQKFELTQLNQQIRLLQTQSENKIDSFTENLSTLEQSIQQLNQNYQTNQSRMIQQLSQVNNQMTKDQDSISTLDRNLINQWLYGSLGLLILLLLLVISYLLLNKRIRNNYYSNMEVIAKTRQYLEEENVKIDHKLIELLENQIKLNQVETTTPPNVTKETDHSLALKVADEIIRIHKNISNMDSTTKGLKQLSASVKRIQDNFLANGYELVDMLGKDYQEGMNAIANFVTSDELPTGVQRITRIIKPQVNYNNVMIQAAQIEVTIGE